nr:serine/threonine-protein kinase PCRK1 isoform X2 [Ipomoea batatas]
MFLDSGTTESGELVGYCASDDGREESQRLWVYEYLANRALQDRLPSRSSRHCRVCKVEDSTVMLLVRLAIPSRENGTFRDSTSNILPGMEQWNGKAFRFRLAGLAHLTEISPVPRRSVGKRRGRGAGVHPRPRPATPRASLELRRVFTNSSPGHKEWVTEVNVLGVVDHPNLVKLVGYCAEDDERGIQRLLVYEYLANRSVQDRLSSRFLSPLPWSARLKIAQDAARGLAYLHEGMDFQMSSGRWAGGVRGSGVHPDRPAHGQERRLELRCVITGRRPMDRNRPKNEQKFPALGQAAHYQGLKQVREDLGSSSGGEILH